MTDTFNKALSNLINDSACGGAVRHLADLGYSVSEITGRLDFPLPKITVADMVWKYYLEVGIIRLEAPKENDYVEKVSYVKDVSSYGKSSLRRVVERVDMPSKEYVRCDFGKKLRRGDSDFMAKIDELDKSDKEYIMDLPWPLTTVYHVVDARMERLLSRNIVEKGI